MTDVIHVDASLRIPMFPASYLNTVDIIMANNSESLARHLGLDHAVDIALVPVSQPPIRKPPLPALRADQRDLFRFGRTFGAIGTDGARVRQR